VSCMTVCSNIVFWLSNAVCEFRKSFAKIANRLQKSQTALESSKTAPLFSWRKRASVQIAYAHRMKLHVVYAKSVDTWMWQIGNEFFYERGSAASEDDAKQSVVQICNAYHRWEMMHAAQFLTTIVWRQVKQDYVGTGQGYDFWISPLDETNRLWRYDIYFTTDTKSVRSGVTRSLPLAQRACVRAITTIDAS